MMATVFVSILLVIALVAPLAVLGLDSLIPLVVTGVVTIGAIALAAREER